MNVNIFLNVLFSLKIEMQYYLQDLMNTVNKRKTIEIMQVYAIFFFLFLYLVFFLFVFFYCFNRSVTQCFVITNYLFSLSLSLFNQNNLAL